MNQGKVELYVAVGKDGSPVVVKTVATPNGRLSAKNYDPRGEIPGIGIGLRIDGSVTDLPPLQREAFARGMRLAVDKLFELTGIAQPTTKFSPGTVVRGAQQSAE